MVLINQNHDLPQNLFSETISNRKSNLHSFGTNPLETRIRIFFLDIHWRKNDFWRWLKRILEYGKNMKLTCPTTSLKLMIRYKSVCGVVYTDIRSLPTFFCTLKCTLFYPQKKSRWCVNLSIQKKQKWVRQKTSPGIGTRY